MPNSSAWIVARIAQLTTCAHCVSPSATAGASGSLEKTSGRIVSASGPSGIGAAQTGQLAGVGRPPVALAGHERSLDLIGVVERADLPVQPEPVGLGRRVALGRRALGDADDRVRHVLERGEAAVGGDHHPLAVVEVRMQERRTFDAVPAGRPRGVADQHVDRAALQGGEPIGGLEVDELGLRRVAEHGRGDDLAEVGVEADVIAGWLEHREPGERVAGAATHRVVGGDRREQTLAGATAGATRVFRGRRAIGAGGAGWASATARRSRARGRGRSAGAVGCGGIAVVVRARTEAEREQGEQGDRASLRH